MIGVLKPAGKSAFWGKVRDMTNPKNSVHIPDSATAAIILLFMQLSSRMVTNACNARIQKRSDEGAKLLKAVLLLCYGFSPSTLNFVIGVPSGKNFT